MRKIIKNNEPDPVTEWKAKADDNWQPTYKELSGNEKRAMRSSLLAEQGGLCCYCNKNITDDDFHLEHFRPQETFEDLQLEYTNIHASCVKGRVRGAPQTCGVAKDNWFDEVLTLSPLNDNARRFKYLSSGEIEAAEPNDAAARLMIKKLKLDDKTLKSQREAEISGTLSYDFIAEASEAELIELYRKLSDKINGVYSPFSIAIQQEILRFLPDELAANL